MIMAWASAHLSLLLGWLSRLLPSRTSGGTTVARPATPAQVAVEAASMIGDGTGHIRQLPAAFTQGDAFTVASVLWIFGAHASMMQRPLPCWKSPAGPGDASPPPC